MTELIIRQASLFLISFLYGSFLGLWYDFFRVIRKKIGHGDRMVHIEDVFFCFSAVGGLFLLFHIYNHGSIRFYVFLGVWLGAMVYFIMFSWFAERILLFALKGILTLKAILFLGVQKPVKKIVNSFLKSLKNVVRTARIIKSRK